MIFVGKKALSVDMGLFGKYHEEQFINAINKIEYHAKKNGIMLATSVAYKNEEYELIKKGYRIITIASDVSILSNQSRHLVQVFIKLKEGVERHVT